MVSRGEPARGSIWGACSTSLWRAASSGKPDGESSCQAEPLFVQMGGMAEDIPGRAGGLSVDVAEACYLPQLGRLEVVVEVLACLLPPELRQVLGRCHGILET